MRKISNNAQVDPLMMAGWYEEESLAMIHVVVLAKRGYVVTVKWVEGVWEVRGVETRSR